MGEHVDIESTGGDISGDEQIGGAAAQAAHHPVSLLLADTAVQGLSSVAPTVQGLGQFVDLDRVRQNTSAESGASTSRIRPNAADLYALGTM